MAGQPKGSFPLPGTVHIISLAMYCTCGYTKFTTTLEPFNENCIKAGKQQESCRVLIECVMSHRPQWLVGCNNYAFDNTCLITHMDLIRDTCTCEIR